LIVAFLDAIIPGNMEVLDNIPVGLDLEKVLRELNLRRVSKSTTESVQELIEMVCPVARPKAFYKISYVDNKNEDSLDIDGARFTSRVLRINLDKVERVFPYVATCGREVDEITVPSHDLMKNYYLDVVKEMILDSAVGYLKNYLTRTYALGQISEMSPGSLASWPITQQKELFSILGDVKALIGVELTESCLMIPIKSVSGIYFPTDIRFESCQLCSREGCRERRAPYDPDLAKKYSQEI
jgi:hypothetical protein